MYFLRRDILSLRKWFGVFFCCCIFAAATDETSLEEWKRTRHKKNMCHCRALPCDTQVRCYRFSVCETVSRNPIQLWTLFLLTYFVFDESITSSPPPFTDTYLLAYSSMLAAAEAAAQAISFEFMLDKLPLQISKEFCAFSILIFLGISPNATSLYFPHINMFVPLEHCLSVRCMHRARLHEEVLHTENQFI